MKTLESLIGRTIVAIRELTDDEKDQLDWWGYCPVLILDDGTELTPSQDEEGNGPGALFID